MAGRMRRQTVLAVALLALAVVARAQDDDYEDPTAPVGIEDPSLAGEVLIRSEGLKRVTIRLFLGQSWESNWQFSPTRLAAKRTEFKKDLRLVLATAFAVSPSRIRFPERNQPARSFAVNIATKLRDPRPLIDVNVNIAKSASTQMLIGTVDWMSANGLMPWFPLKWGLSYAPCPRGSPIAIWTSLDPVTGQDTLCNRIINLKTFFPDSLIPPPPPPEDSPELSPPVEASPEIIPEDSPMPIPDDSPIPDPSPIPARTMTTTILIITLNADFNTLSDPLSLFMFKQTFATELMISFKTQLMINVLSINIESVTSGSVVVGFTVTYESTGDDIGALVAIQNKVAQVNQNAAEAFSNVFLTTFAIDPIPAPPQPSPEPSPEPVPEVSPVPVPEDSPVPVPEDSPVPVPEASPEISAETSIPEQSPELSGSETSLIEESSDSTIPTPESSPETSTGQDEESSDAEMSGGQDGGVPADSPVPEPTPSPEMSIEESSKAEMSESESSSTEASTTEASATEASVEESS